MKTDQKTVQQLAPGITLHTSTFITKPCRFRGARRKSKRPGSQCYRIGSGIIVCHPAYKQMLINKVKESVSKERVGHGKQTSAAVFREWQKATSKEAFSDDRNRNSDNEKQP